MNRLILGDCLEVLKNIENESVDLIYIDPPFFSNRTYEIVWGDKGEIRSFEDRFSGGIDHYIAWLKDRVEQMHRILKPTGSMFLHCDWHANAYIRTIILDRIFGYDNFRGEIIWQRHNAHNDARKKLAVLKDSIFYYTKNGEYSYNPIYIGLSDEYKNNFYRFEDEKGIFRLSDLTAPNINPNDKEWRGFHPNKSGRHWAIPVQVILDLVGEEESKKLDTGQKLELLYENGFIQISKTGIPSFKRYLDNSKGALLGDIWTDIKNISPQSKEKIGYPTQKPEKLLERIISMASNEGDTVLDCFLGGGTTIAVADKLNRKWIGIDQSTQAINVTQMRLNLQQGKMIGKSTDMFAKPFTTLLYRYDREKLFTQNPFAFETWIIEQFGGIANKKQRSDSGIDGFTKEKQPIQVKQSENIGRNVIDNFFSAIQRSDKANFEKNKTEKLPIGYIIAFSFGKGAIQEVARLKNQENVLIKLVEVGEIVPLSQKPNLSIEIKDLGTQKDKREIEFTAKAESEYGVAFFSWDFHYQNSVFEPEILRDTIGKQTYEFEAGDHQIAIKVFDNEGLESLEVVRLKINGKVERG